MVLCPLYFDNYAYGITDDNVWLLAAFTVDEENYVLVEVVPVKISEFLNGNAISEVEEICDELASDIYYFWSKYHDQIYEFNNRNEKLKLFESNPCTDELNK